MRIVATGSAAWSWACRECWVPRNHRDRRIGHHHDRVQRANESKELHHLSVRSSVYQNERDDLHSGLNPSTTEAGREAAMNESRDDLIDMAAKG